MSEKTIKEYWLPTLIVGLMCVLGMYGCAQVASPPGGKKDTLSPKLVLSFPKNQSLNFKGKEISLEFNEYIKVDNILQQMIVTPGLDGGFEPKPNPYGLKLKLENNLRPNTTYNFNFRNSIKDATESNIAKNIRLVFSTGNQIDSLKVSGRVKNIQTDEGYMDAQIGLYEWSDTLNPSKNKPYYFVKTDSSGNFLIENVRSGSYKIYAILDANNNLLWDKKNEPIGFKTDTVNLLRNRENIEFTINKVDVEPNKVTKFRNTSSYFYIDYQKGIKEAKIETNKDSLISMIHEKGNQLIIYNTTQSTDTILAKITVTDTLGREFKHEQKIKFKPKTNKKDDAFKEKFSFKTEPVNGEDLDLEEVGYEISFTKPVKNIDWTKIKILNDTTTSVKVDQKSIVINKQRTLLTFKAEKKQKPKENIRLSFQKGAFIGIESDTSLVLTHSHPKRDEENYGSITGKVKNPNKKGFIVQLLNEKYSIIKESANKENYRFDYIKAGTYFVRIIVDENKNGRWDFSDVEKNKQPEPIIFLKNKIPIKANFELEGNDFEI
jgi:hypothetical protein